ncbi:hypothetical protein OIV85_002411 [Enterococcus faecalis]|nr:hypothetical protein [Enterococcus faecalis]
MDKYRNAKTPPSIYFRMKLWGWLVFTDLLVVAFFFLVAKQGNTIFGLGNVMGFVNYFFSFVIAILLITVPKNNPEEPRYKLLFYALIMDVNNYHSLDNQRTYHKKNEV